MINYKGVLYIEPSGNISPQPLIDEFTRKMTAAYRKSFRGPAFRGRHTCKCGSHSDNYTHMLPNGANTNSLCIHYLAFHRDEVLAMELEKVKQLDCGESEPTLQELSIPVQKPEPHPPVTRCLIKAHPSI